MIRYPADLGHHLPTQELPLPSGYHGGEKRDQKNVEIHILLWLYDLVTHYIAHSPTRREALISCLKLLS